MSGAAEAARFLARHGMDAGGMDFSALRALWLDAMERGLRGEAGTMHMLPAFVRPDCESRDGDPVLVMDAGGTNLRTALVRLTPGGMETLYFSKTAMPGSRGPLTADEFFTMLARQLLPVADRAPRACLCFSYPCRIRPDGDGELIGLCKELQVTGAEGALVCARLEAALQALGAPGARRWRLINDTVAALLGAVAMAPAGRYGGFIGFILGTGVNLSYGEPASRITKSPEAMRQDGRMAVNTESGCFSGLPQGSVDRALDAASSLPGDHLAEKMISGGYLPDILYGTLQTAEHEGLLPAGAVRLPRLTMTQFDALLEGRLPAGFAGGCGAAFCCALADGILQRAALFAASMLAAAAARSTPAGGLPLCVCAEGTTVNRTPTFLARIRTLLEREVTEKGGPVLEFVTLEDATLAGSALAAMQA